MELLTQVSSHYNPLWLYNKNVQFTSQNHLTEGQSRLQRSVLVWDVTCMRWFSGSTWCHIILMLIVLDIWCLHRIPLLPGMWSSHSEPHRVKMSHYSKCFNGGFTTGVNKKGFFRPDQMPRHTRYPWIQAVSWQPLCLSVVMETSVSNLLPGNIRNLVRWQKGDLFSKCIILKEGNIISPLCELSVHHAITAVRASDDVCPDRK